MLAIKLPLLLTSYYLYRIIHDVPDPEIENDGGDFVRAEFEQGPRNRGPHGRPPALAASVRRADPGHKDAPAIPRNRDHSAAE